MKLDSLEKEKQMLINELVDNPSHKSPSDLAHLRDITSQINRIRGDL